MTGGGMLAAGLGSSNGDDSFTAGFGSLKGDGIGGFVDCIGSFAVPDDPGFDASGTENGEGGGAIALGSNPPLSCRSKLGG
jgi:hypothetical protein